MTDYKAIKLIKNWVEYCFPWSWQAVYCVDALIVWWWWGGSAVWGWWGWGQVICTQILTTWNSICAHIGAWWVWGNRCCCYMWNDGGASSIVAWCTKVVANWWQASGGWQPKYYCCWCSAWGEMWGTSWSWYRWWRPGTYSYNLCYNYAWWGGGAWGVGWASPWSNRWGAWWAWLCWYWWWGWWYWASTWWAWGSWGGWAWGSGYNNGCNGTKCWWWGWGTRLENSGSTVYCWWNWAKWVVDICYACDGSYWFSCATWGNSCYLCWNICVHRFTSNWTFTIVS